MVSLGIHSEDSDVTEGDATDASLNEVENLMLELTRMSCSKMLIEKETQRNPNTPHTCVFKEKGRSLKTLVRNG